MGGNAFRGFRLPSSECEMQTEDFAFGSIRIDGITHEHDVVIEAGEIRKRKKGIRRNSVTTWVTLPCLWRKTSPGNTAGW